ANGLIVGGVRGATGVAGDHGLHTVELPIDRLDTPETATAQHRHLRVSAGRDVTRRVGKFSWAQAAAAIGKITREGHASFPSWAIRVLPAAYGSCGDESTLERPSRQALGGTRDERWGFKG